MFFLEKMDDEVVFVRVFDDSEKKDAFYEGKVCTDVTPNELVKLRCFVERGVSVLRKKSTLEEVRTFKGLQCVELIASFSFSYEPFKGILYTSSKDGVLRKLGCSSTLPSCDISTWMSVNIVDDGMNHFFFTKFHPALQEVSMANCSLQALPPEVGHTMKSLKKLQLVSISNLATLPPEIGLLCHLEELLIGYCSAFHQLPSTLGQLVKLEKLFLYSLTELKSLPEEMGFLCNLKHLALNGCGIVSLPKSMNQMMLDKMELSYMWHLQHCDVSRVKHLRIAFCDSFFLPPLHSLCQMLKSSVRLHSFALQSTHQLHSSMLIKALQENGSIVEITGGCDAVLGLDSIAARNKANHDTALQSTMRLMAMRNSRRALVILPKEMVEIIAKMLWITRCDVDTWKKK